MKSSIRHILGDPQSLILEWIHLLSARYCKYGACRSLLQISLTEDLPMIRVYIICYYSSYLILIILYERLMVPLWYCVRLDQFEYHYDMNAGFGFNRDKGRTRTRKVNYNSENFI